MILEMLVSYLCFAVTDCGIFVIGMLRMLLKMFLRVLFQEEIEIEAKVLRAGKAVGVATVELRKKNGKLIAQARYTKYLATSSNL